MFVELLDRTILLQRSYIAQNILISAKEGNFALPIWDTGAK